MMAMGTIRTPECEWIEQAIREEMAPSIDVECRQVYDTKTYIVWLTIEYRSHPIRFAMESYQDDRWKPIVRAGLEELNASTSN
jgi:hypothetical protein